MTSCVQCGRYFFPDTFGQAHCGWMCQAQDEERQDLDPDALVAVRYCVICGDVIPVERGSKEVFCSPDCRDENDQRDRDCIRNFTHLGAAAELKVAADLLDQGYYVFRSLTLHCPCDLLAWREGGPFLRVEVKQTTARGGKVKGRALRLAKGNRYDVLAVCAEGQIQYLDVKGKPARM